MELKYIWIKKYSVIDKLNINFNHSGVHEFRYDERRIVLSNKTKGSIDFGERISGITAIAGKNGSGKSSVCEAVLSAVATFKEGMFGNEIVFDGIVCFNNTFFYQQDLIIENLDEIREAGYVPEPFEYSPLQNMRGEWTPDVIRAGFVYYSNVLDMRSGFGMTNLSNISTQAILEDEYKYGTDYPTTGGQTMPSEIGRYRLGQGYRVMRFYLRHRDFIPFRGPSQFVLRSTYSHNNRFLNIVDETVSQEIQEYLAMEEARIFAQVADAGSAYDYQARRTLRGVDAKYLIHQLYKLNLLRAYTAATSKQINPGVMHAFLSVTTPGIVDGIPPLLQIGAQLHAAIIDRAEKEDLEFSPHFMRSHYEGGDWRFLILATLELENDSDAQNAVALDSLLRFEKAFFSRYGRSIGRISNYSFSPYFSSGEYSFLTLFSRLMDVVDRYSTSSQGRDKLLLFLDEPEIGFHPEWSKKFLKYLLKFLNERTTGFDFQLIVTTHSPYFLSDLPSKHVILLDREEGEATRIVTSGKFETFGANINDLLADSFFLKDGAIGEFAKDIIQGIIDTLNRWRLQLSEPQFRIPDGEKVSVREIISLVGDSIVRNKLFDMYWEATGDRMAVSSEIAQLEDRINKLRLRNDDNNR